MSLALQHSPFGYLAHAFAPLEESLVHLSLAPLVRQIEGDLTDECLELLLDGMKLALCASADYRRNIDGFTGTYVFGTSDGAVLCSAVFGGGELEVRGDAVDDPDVTVLFKDPPAFWRFVFSENQDVLDSVLANEVSVRGNVNYVYRFGFLARDLARRLRVG